MPMEKQQPFESMYISSWKLGGYSMVIGRFSGVFLHSGAQKIVMENHHLLFVVENASSNGPFFIAIVI